MLFKVAHFGWYKLSKLSDDFINETAYFIEKGIKKM